MTDWNPLDPDYENVFYDLSSWSIDHQSEMTAALAQADIPHAWVESELVVPAEFEDKLDSIFDRLEQELGIGSTAVIGGVAEGEGLHLNAGQRQCMCTQAHAQGAQEAGKKGAGTWHGGLIRRPAKCATCGAVARLRPTAIGRQW